MSTKFIILMISGVTFLSLTTASTANTCPTELKQNKQGFWFSKEKPGWMSHKATPHDVTLSADQFGGAVFSPTRERIACVYKASNGKWIALVSEQHSGFKIDKTIMDDAGSAPAWKYSAKHQDYACGSPHVTDIKKCAFNFEKEQ